MIQNLSKNKGQRVDQVEYTRVIDGGGGGILQRVFKWLILLRVFQDMSRGAEQTTDVRGTRGHQQITTVFVDNISPALHWQGLWHAFARHVNVVDAFIARKLSRGGRRYGFVRFEMKADAWRAIERLNGFSLFGQRISVTLAHNNSRTQYWKKVRQDNTKKLTQDQPGERTPYSGDNRKATEAENITKNRKVVM
ncbi:hypothetical protein GQ457_06G000960 [Hibiscus cannabinus]